MPSSCRGNSQLSMKASQVSRAILHLIDQIANEQLYNQTSLIKMVRIPSHAKNFKHSNKRSTLCKGSSTTGKTRPSTYSRNISLTTVSLQELLCSQHNRIHSIHTCTCAQQIMNALKLRTPCTLKDRLSLVEDIINRTQGQHRSYRLIGVEAHGLMYICKEQYIL